MLYGGCFTRIKHDERERMTMLEILWVAEKKKREREKNINKIKKMKRNKNKTEEEGRNLFFFFGMKRKSRTWQSYEKDSTLECSFCTCTRLSCSSLPREISTWPNKRFGRLSSPEFSIFFLFFFPFRLIARIARYPRRVCRVSRVRVRNCVVLRICVRARGCKYNN